jgi:hypothetical protein
VDEVGGYFQGDGAELVRVVDLLQVDVAGGADREEGGGGAYLVAQRGVRAREHLDERVEAAAEPVFS